ncbi:GatB/YqeY domain-containing protein [Lachnobacterium bovis]|uniref:GatB/YqeY domain-containing protein n=1 Tax=Lachnobacterium bovis TaxID=140626 RepID=UPI00049047A5|nr:GatB/YqeY domain-containing protein [Lachnobacterium bovis]
MKFEELRAEMIKAMKARDKKRKEVISSLISASKKIAIDEGTRDEISDEQVNRAISKELRIAKEQLEGCPAEREDLKEEYSFIVSVIEEFAPKMLSQEEIEAFLNENFAEILATKNKGQIMKNVMPALKGKADGKDIQQVVSKLIG